MLNIGGYSPGFRFKMNPQTANPKIISFASSGIITGYNIDASFSIINYSGGITGTQYMVQVVPEQLNLFGYSPSVSLSTNNTGIATIDQFGNVSFVNTGYFNVIGYASGTPYNAPETISIPFINSSGLSTNNNITTTYFPDAININKHVLIIYNTNSNDSVNLKNYYTGHRPLFSGANILGISCPSGLERISYSGFTGLIRQPIINYLTGISGTKPIRYAVMMCDIPTRVLDTNLQSVSYQLYTSYQQLGLRNGNDYTNQFSKFSLGQFQQNTLLISYINFANYQDCTSYIDRISLGQTGIYLTGNGHNTGYCFDDAGSAGNFIQGRHLNTLLSFYPSLNYAYSPYSGQRLPTGYSGVAGYCSWGTNCGMGQFFPLDGEVKWARSNNNWYIINTLESFNGQTGTLQCSFINWFKSGAFGGTGYENCPVGGVGHVEEPYLNYTADSGYFLLWQSGYSFIECAWQSRRTPYNLVLGDPFIHI